MTPTLHTAVILNGPPNCGKDTLADLMTEYGFRKHQMKDRLYRDTADFFDVPLNDLLRRATDRKLKEEPWDLLRLPRNMVTSFAISPREALIHTSESFIKPNHGDDYFGLAAAQACQEAGSTLAVFSDGGFASEIAPLQQAYQNVIIFRLHREGCSFAGDSRNFLRGFDSTYDIALTDGRPDLALIDIMNHLDSYIGSCLRIAI